MLSKYVRSRLSIAESCALVSGANHQLHGLQLPHEGKVRYRDVTWQVVKHLTCSANTMPASSPAGSRSRGWDPPAGPAAELRWPSRGASAEAASASVTFSSSTSDSPGGAAAVSPEQQIRHAGIGSRLFTLTGSTAVSAITFRCLESLSLCVYPRRLSSRGCVAAPHLPQNILKNGRDQQTNLPLVRWVQGLAQPPPTLLRLNGSLPQAPQAAATAAGAAGPEPPDEAVGSPRSWQIARSWLSSSSICAQHLIAASTGLQPATAPSNGQ